MVHESFTHAQITEQVNKISSSSILKNSPVLRQFLHFVVGETLEGNGDRIKEYTIGTQVLGRKTDFDPQLDAIVRIHAGRLRRALNEFYLGEGKGDIMRISIPKGGYSADFAHNGRLDHAHDTRPAVIADKLKRPVVAVMPFRNISNDFSHESFCQEIGEFVSTELARFQELSLISYSSCASVANKTKDIGEIGSMLGADYVLTGSIFLDHQNLRMLLQLSRGDSAKQLWSNTFARSLAQVNLFEIQEEIVNLVTSSLGGYYGVIYRDVVEVSLAKGARETYSAIVWYDQFFKRLDKTTFEEACESLEDIVKENPEYALGWAILSEFYSVGVIMGMQRLDDQISTAVQYAERAIRLDPFSQHAYQALSRAHVLTQNKSEVIFGAEKCIALNARATNFSARAGTLLIYAGEYERGAKILKDSLQRNPFYQWMSSMALSIYHYERKEFKESMDWADKLDMPQRPWVLILKAACLVELGLMEDAKKQIEHLLVLKPDITILGKTFLRYLILDDRLADKLIDSLEKTGLNMRNQALSATVNR